MPYVCFTQPSGGHVAKSPGPSPVIAYCRPKGPKLRAWRNGVGHPVDGTAEPDRSGSLSFHLLLFLYTPSITRMNSGNFARLGRGGFVQDRPVPSPVRIAGLVFGTALRGGLGGGGLEGLGLGQTPPTPLGCRLGRGRGGGLGSRRGWRLRDRSLGRGFGRRRAR